MSLPKSRPGKLAATGIAASALGAAALLLPATALAQGDRAFGQITSVSGDSFEVSTTDGTTTVKFTDATRISESVPAQRGDVVVGTCITAGAPDAGDVPDGGVIDAKWVSISTTVDGKCAQWGGPGATAAGAPHRHHGARGVVDSVSGDTVTITRTAQDGATSQATVKLDDATAFHRRVPAAAPAIAIGKCTASRGSLGADGTLDAERVTVWPAKDGTCQRPGR